MVIKGGEKYSFLMVGELRMKIKEILKEPLLMGPIIFMVILTVAIIIATYT